MTEPKEPQGDVDLQLEHETLLEAVRALTSTLELDTVLQRLLYITNKTLGFEYCTILLIEEGDKRLSVAARYGYPESIVQSVDLAVGKGLTGRVAQTGEPIIVPDVSKEERYLAGLKGARSELVVPLKFEGRVIGVFDVQSPKINAFKRRDMDFLSVLASVASVAITNARSYAAALRSRDEESKRRRLERQLGLGRTIQEQLLPQSDPELPGYDIAGMNLPTETISGDYFDFLELPEGQLGIAVADVSGKGVPAALLAASLQGTLRSQVQNLYSIATIMERANASLCRSTTHESYATLFYGVLQPDGTITYVNAGHNPPFILRGDGGVEMLDAGGTVLGMFPDRSYDEGRATIHHGDYLVIYTDGLSEAFHAGEEFGEKRIIETAQRVSGAPSRVMASVLITEANSFWGPQGSMDDMTVVVVRRTPIRSRQRPDPEAR